MRALARRIALLDEAAPQLVAERGIGHITAAQFYLAWSHPGRCHSEAAFARLGGTSPGPRHLRTDQTRYLLNRGGDRRQLNRALYLVAVTKQRCDPPPPAATSPDESPKANPNAKPSAASNASSPAASGASSNTRRPAT